MDRSLESESWEVSISYSEILQGQVEIERLRSKGTRSLGTRPLLFDHGIRVYNVARIEQTARDTGVGRSLFFLSVMDDREETWTYSEEVRDPSELPKSWELPLCHVAFNLLGLLDSPILPSLRVLGEAIFHLDGIDTGKPELVLTVLKWTTNSDGQKGSLNGMLDNEIFNRREDRISSLGIGQVCSDCRDHHEDLDLGREGGRRVGEEGR